MTERKEPFEAGRDAIRNLAEKFADPTEAEIAAADCIYHCCHPIELDESEDEHETVVVLPAENMATIISQYNTLLHAKIAAQKAALELAKEALSEVDSRFEGNDVYLRRRSTLAAIKEALQ